MRAKVLLEPDDDFHGPHLWERAGKPAVLILLALLWIAVPVSALDQSDGALGISLYNQGRLVEAKEVLERVVETGTAGFLELAVLGMTCIKLGELDRAAQILEEARRQGPFSSLVHIGLGMLSFEQRDFESAYESFDLARRIEPDSEQARAGIVASLVNRAILLYREGRDQHAVEFLQEALRIDPRAVTVLQNLSIIERSRGDLERAASHLEAGLNLEPANPVLLGMLIQVRTDQGRREELAELYRRLIAVQPRNALAYAELGVLLEQEGDLQAAERAFLKAESLDTEEPYPHFYLARLSRRQGAEQKLILSRLHSAIGKSVRKSAALQMQAAGAIQGSEGSLEPEQIETLQRLSAQVEQPRQILREALALLEETHGSTEAYAGDVQRLSDWYPHSLELRVAVGRVLEEQGLFAEARLHWLEVLEDRPTAAEAHLGLARTLEQLGRLEEARVAFRRARDLDPENLDIYAALLRLYAAEEEELLQWYGELYERERTNVVLLDSWADLEERLGYAEQAARHRLRARALEQRENRE